MNHEVFGILLAIFFAGLGILSFPWVRDRVRGRQGQDDDSTPPQ